MQLNPGKETRREVVITYESPPREVWRAFVALGWSWHHALSFVGVPEEHIPAVIDGSLAPDWAPIIAALNAEHTRQCGELGPLLVAHPAWCEEVPDPDFEGREGGAIWHVTLHSQACDPAYVTRRPEGTWEICDAGGPSIETTIREVRDDLEVNDGMDFLNDASCWHPALRPHLRAHL